MSNHYGVPGNSNNSNRRTRGSEGADREAAIRQQIRDSVAAMQCTATVMHDRVRRVRPPVFRDIAPPAQMLPQMVQEFTTNGLVMDPSENRPMVRLPDEFYKFDSAETSTLLSILLDSNHTRLIRLLSQVHIRAMLREDRYYQLVDDPSLYFRSKCTDLPAFHNRVVLYLTTPGVLIYLKQSDALAVFSRVQSKGVLPRTNKMMERRVLRQSKRLQPQADFSSALNYERRKNEQMTPFINVDAYQYATYVHCYDGDILRFQLDYLAVKRDYQDALPIMMDMGWEPESPSLLLYRRRYYQYMTPFLDWVDMMRYQLKITPTLSITGFYERLLAVNSVKVDIDDLRCLGHSMVECFELRRLCRENCPLLPDMHGHFAGRKVYRDKDPRVHSALTQAFHGSLVRPVMPNACSPTRRFLIHLNYYDRRCMTSLPQMMALVEYMLQQQFFAMHPLCRTSNIRFEPLVFQIYDFVWCMRQHHNYSKLYLRQESWETIKKSEDGYAWYLRWDTFNSICLLLSILQNAIQRDIDDSLIERLVHIIIDVLRSSEFLEAFVSYSFFDTYLGLSSVVNCVPNFSLYCFQRVLHTVPFHLCGTLSSSEVFGTFSDRFWRSSARVPSNSDGSGGGKAGAASELPRTLRDMSEMLMTRSRKVSVQQPPVMDTSDLLSGMSAVGSTGAMVLFIRDYAQMPKVVPEVELAVVSNDTVDANRRADEEDAHVNDFRQREIDYRYGQVFTDAYCMAVGRPQIFYEEYLTYSECRAMSMAPYRQVD